MESDFFITGGVAIVCLVYSILILILFLMKKKSNKISTTLYFILLVCTVLSIGFYVLNSYISIKGFSYALYTARFLSFTICVWEFLFMLYVTFAFNTDEDNRIIFDKHKKLINKNEREQNFETEFCSFLLHKIYVFRFEK